MMNNPYQQMAVLDRAGTTYTVNVKTANQGVELEFENAGVMSHDGDWLVLQCPGDDVVPAPPPLWVHKKQVAALTIEVA